MFDDDVNEPVRRRRWYVRPAHLDRETAGAYETNVNSYRMHLDVSFESFLSTSIEYFNYLLHRVGPRLQHVPTHKLPLCPATRLTICLRYNIVNEIYRIRTYCSVFVWPRVIIHTIQVSSLWWNLRVDENALQNGQDHHGKCSLWSMPSHHRWTVSREFATHEHISASRRRSRVPHKMELSVLLRSPGWEAFLHKSTYV